MRRPRLGSPEHLLGEFSLLRRPLAAELAPAVRALVQSAAREQRRSVREGDLWSHELWRRLREAAGALLQTAEDAAS
jgi:hypothetical protein